MLLRIVQGMLVGGAVVLFVRALTGLALPDGAPPAAGSVEPPPVPDAGAAADRFGRIAERNLFHRRIEEPVEPAPPPVVESTLDVQLLGTLVTIQDRDGRDASSVEAGKARPPSLAILRDVDGKVRTLARGDVFADERAKLVAIERGRIVLEHGERLEALTLEEGVLAAQACAPRPIHGAPPDPAARAAEARAEEIARMQREVQRRMREAMPQVGAAPPVTSKN